MLVLVQRRKQVGMPMICRFADWELDTGLFELRYQGSPRQVEPQVFNLIELLVRNHHRVVGRDEILAELWKGRVVTDATLSTCVKSARQALGDTGRAQALIRTVSGRGFRFVGEVDIVESDAPTAITPVTVPSTPITRLSVTATSTTRLTGRPKANRVAFSRARSSRLMEVALNAISRAISKTAPSITRGSAWRARTRSGGSSIVGGDIVL